MTIHTSPHTVLPYASAVEYLAWIAKSHSEKKPIIAGLYGMPSAEKQSLARAVDARLAELRDSETEPRYVIGPVCSNAMELVNAYRRMIRPIHGATIPLIFLPEIDTGCAKADEYAAGAFGKLCDMTICVVGRGADELDFVAGAFVRSRDMRRFYAKRYEIPYTIPEYLVIRPPS